MFWGRESQELPCCSAIFFFPFLRPPPLHRWYGVEVPERRCGSRPQGTPRPVGEAVSLQVAGRMQQVPGSSPCLRALSPGKGEVGP